MNAHLEDAGKCVRSLMELIRECCCVLPSFILKYFAYIPSNGIIKV